MAERREAASRSVVVAAFAAGHPERGLAVDEVQARVGDNDSVVVQLEAALSEGLTLVLYPLQRGALALLVVTWRTDGAQLQSE